MTSTPFKSLGAVLLAATALSAAAAASTTNYYIVVPVLGKRAPAPVISVALAQATLAPGLVGTLYPPVDLKNSLSVTGDPNFDASLAQWSLESGTLPANLALSATGILSGTPTTEGTSDFSLKAVYKSVAGVQSYQLKVVNPPLAVSIGQGPLLPATVGTNYTFDFKSLMTVTGDPQLDVSKGYWQIVGGVLPANLTLSTAGVLSGAPTDPGTSNFNVRVTYKGLAHALAYQLVVALPPDLTLRPYTKVAYVNQPVSWNLQPWLTFEGDPTFDQSQVAWSLPAGSVIYPGMTLSANGLITGVANNNFGYYTFAVKATYKGQSVVTNFFMHGSW